MTTNQTSQAASAQLRHRLDITDSTEEAAEIIAELEKRERTYTKGPWQVHGCLVEAADGTVIADTTPVGDVSDAPANARLIAAAPSHDAAIRKMVSAIEDMLDDDSLQITSDCGDLLLQIASIGGESIRKAESN